MSDFISSYMEYNQMYESPSSFWRWSAYATIAAVLRDNIYLGQGERKLFPNIYILFIAESSGHRKNAPIDLSESLVLKVKNTKTIGGRASIQAIMDELVRAETDRKTGAVLKAGSAILYAQELSASIVSDPEAIKILTDIYDYKANPYKNRLRTGPCFELDHIVFSMLAGSNEDMIKDFFTIVAVKGGLLARTALIVPNEFRPSNSLTDLDTEERNKGKEILVDKLKEISKLSGVFRWTDEGKEEYNTWYNPFRQSYSSKKEASGVVGRIHTSILKLACVFAANELRFDIRKQDIEQAINEYISLIPNYSIFTMHNGKSEISNAGAIIITELLNAKNYTMARKELLRRHWQDGIDLDMLDKIALTLETAGQIISVQDGKNSIAFKLTDTCLETLTSSGKR